MWSIGVVVHPPRLDDFSSFGERREVVLVEAFVAELAVETLDEGILSRFSRDDMMQPNAAIDCPSQHGEARELRAVVQNDRLRIAANRGNCIEDANDALAAERRIDFDGKGFVREVVDDGKSPNTPLRLQGIVNEVQRPAFVHRGNDRSGVAATKSEAPANSASHLQMSLAVDAPDPLEIHDNTFTAEQHS